MALQVSESGGVGVLLFTTQGHTESSSSSGLLVSSTTTYPSREITLKIERAGTNKSDGKKKVWLRSFSVHTPIHSTDQGRAGYSSSDLLLHSLCPNSADKFDVVNYTNKPCSGGWKLKIKYGYRATVSYIQQTIITNLAITFWLWNLLDMITLTLQVLIQQKSVHEHNSITCSVPGSLCSILNMPGCGDHFTGVLFTVNVTIKFPSLKVTLLGR